MSSQSVCVSICHMSEYLLRVLGDWQPSENTPQYTGALSPQTLQKTSPQSLLQLQECFQCGFPDHCWKGSEPFRWQSSLACIDQGVAAKVLPLLSLQLSLSSTSVLQHTVKTPELWLSQADCATGRGLAVIYVFPGL